MKNAVRSKAMLLNGDSYARGQAQADYVDRKNVVEAIHFRLKKNRAVLARPDVRNYLRQQWEFSSSQCREELAEMEGVADAFRLDANDVFDFLHLGVASNFGAPVTGQDGCSTWAVSNLAEGPVVGKNRDFSGEHAVLQAVFLHQDPSWKIGHRVMCVGSLGCPGVYSSGINSDGLAVVDTHIPTNDVGIGWQRYFLMTHLLAHHNNVDSALVFIKNVPHAGGGSLILSDPTGRVAAVDLGHTSVSIVERNNGWVARTNHFEVGSVENIDDGKPLHRSTMGRRRALTNALSQKTKTLSSLTQLMKAHTAADTEGLCRHNHDGDGSTLSGAIYLCQSRTLYFSNGKPCCTGWEEFSMP